ncbi:MAG: BrxA/BrxB family bacilliredoxin [Ignavibacteriales bacterium CG_4_9_14_3_um_filter_30_11]|nr:MAG: BrxA/BrxB family bacilliredoxin [Ignavibacteriales bacterium CG_4_9_14_3_um_filter_30_11]
MFNITSRAPMYDQNAVQPMRDELVAVGFEELLTAEQVEKVLNVNDNKVKLVLLNSVCGCAAGSARPGVSLALQNKIIPDNLYTAFAGQEREAVEKVRSMITEYAPSSPSVALFKNGILIYFMQRLDIEGHSPEEIANELVNNFNEYCIANGPSVSPEHFEKIMFAKQCGSKIPLYNE